MSAVLVHCSGGYLSPRGKRSRQWFPGRGRRSVPWQSRTVLYDAQNMLHEPRECLRGLVRGRQKVVPTHSCCHGCTSKHFPWRSLVSGPRSPRLSIPCAPGPPRGAGTQRAVSTEDESSGTRLQSCETGSTKEEAVILEYRPLGFRLHNYSNPH